MARPARVEVAARGSRRARGRATPTVGGDACRRRLAPVLGDQQGAGCSRGRTSRSSRAPGRWSSPCRYGSRARVNSTWSARPRHAERLLWPSCLGARASVCVASPDVTRRVVVDARARRPAARMAAGRRHERPVGDARACRQQVGRVVAAQRSGPGKTRLASGVEAADGASSAPVGRRARPTWRGSAITDTAASGGRPADRLHAPARAPGSGGGRPPARRAGSAAAGGVQRRTRSPGRRCTTAR